MKRRPQLGALADRKNSPLLLLAWAYGVNPNDLVLMFNESLVNTPATTAFSTSGITGSPTVSSINVTGVFVTVTMSGPVSSGDSPLISYTQPGSNDLEDIHGNKVANLSNAPIVNNIDSLFGEEKITNGDLTVTTNWTATGLFTFIADVARRSAGSTDSRIEDDDFDASDLNEGDTVEISVEVTSYTSGTLLGGSASIMGPIVIPSQVGVHTAEYKVKTGTRFYLYSNNFEGDVDNISVRRKNTQLPTAPIPVGANLNAADVDDDYPHSVFVNFDKACTGTKLGYSVEIDSVAATVTDLEEFGINIFRLILSETLGKNQVITVSYDDVTGDTVTIGDGIPLESFTDQAVDNDLSYVYRAYDYFEALPATLILPLKDHVGQFFNSIGTLLEDDIDVAWLSYIHDDESTYYNMKDPSVFTLVKGNSPGFTQYKGWKTRGAFNDHFNTNWNLNTESDNYTRDSASFWFSIDGQSQSTASRIMGVSDALSDAMCWANYDGSGLAARINSGSSIRWVPNYPSLILINRSGANDVQVYEDGLLVASQTSNASISVPVGNAYLLAQNDETVVKEEVTGTATLGFAGYAGSLDGTKVTTLTNAWNTLKAAVDALTPGQTPVVVNPSVENTAPFDFVIPLSIACTGTTAGYTPKINGSPATKTGFSGSGTAEFTIPVSDTILPTDNLTVDYDDVTGDTTSVADSTDLVSFTGTAVANNILSGSTGALRNTGIGFESGIWSDKWSRNYGVPPFYDYTTPGYFNGSTEIRSDSPVLAGTYSARHRLQRDFRSEFLPLEAAAKWFNWNEEHWLGLRIYLPDADVAPFPDWFIVLQLHSVPGGYDWDNSAGKNALTFKAGPYGVCWSEHDFNTSGVDPFAASDTGSASYDTSPLTPGSWIGPGIENYVTDPIDLVANFRIGVDDSAFMKCWCQHQLVVDFTGPNIPYRDAGGNPKEPENYLQTGIYKGPRTGDARWGTNIKGQSIIRTAHHDCIRVGTAAGNYALVDPRQDD